MDNPFLLSDSDDDGAFPLLREAPSRSSRSTSVPKSTGAPKSKGRAAAPKSSAKPRSPPKTSKNTTPPTEQQTRLQGFFKTTAKVGVSSARKPRKEKKEKYTVEEQDGVEVYRFL